MSVETLSLVFVIVSAALLGVIVLLVGVILRQRKQLPESVEVAAEPQPEPVMNSVARLEPASNALFATLSHELRTPLNGLLGLSQILQEESPTEESAGIEGCARHMLAVISTLVNLSKIQTEWDDLAEYREWVNIYELMEQIKKDLVFRADLRGLTIELSHQDQSLRLRGDGDHLRAIIENTVLGSIESVPLVQIPRSKKVLSIAWYSEGSDVKIEIANPREEPAEDRRQQIEEVFRMTTGDNHARIKMEYLYWAVSSALLERYNGVMSAHPRDEGGVNTLLSFEMEQMQASSSSELPIGGLSLDKVGNSRKSMLALPVRLSLIVAEDDPIARKLLATVLEHMKQEVTFATNGREVIELIKQSQGCDLILMDIDMPIMDGISAALALREGEAGELGKHVPIVAVTAFAALSDEGKFKRAGMNYFLPKPVKLRKLRQVLLDVIRKERYEG